MKLTKLLPMTTIAGVAAIVTPLVTSCSQNGTEIVWTEKTLPQIDVCQDKFDDAKTATDAYFEAISNDKTLLSKDIVCSNMNTDMFDAITSSRVRTDDVNKDEHKVSFTNKVEGKLLGVTVTNTFDVKNVEYGIQYINDESELDGVYFAPKIFLDIVNVIAEPSTKAITDLMNYVADLVNDHSWHLTYTTVDKKSSIEWTLDYSNVYEYASAQYIMTLIDFPILSYYFKDVFTSK